MNEQLKEQINKREVAKFTLFLIFAMILGIGTAAYLYADKYCMAAFVGLGTINYLRLSFNCIDDIV